MPIYTSAQAEAGALLYPDGSRSNELADGEHQQLIWARFSADDFSGGRCGSP